MSMTIRELLDSFSFFPTPANPDQWSAHCSKAELDEARAELERLEARGRKQPRCRNCGSRTELIPIPLGRPSRPYDYECAKCYARDTSASTP